MPPQNRKASGICLTPGLTAPRGPQKSRWHCCRALENSLASLTDRPLDFGTHIHWRRLGHEQWEIKTEIEKTVQPTLKLL